MTCGRRPMRATALASSLLLLAVTPLRAEVSSNEVYALAERVEAEVDLIRLEMGVDEVIKPDMAVSDAQMREVYFQALTLYEKSGRLLFDLLRERAKPMAPESRSNILPEDVLGVIEGSLGLLLRVKAKLGIPEQVEVHSSDSTRTPTDLFQLVVRIDRTLNTLLRERFMPAEVYRQLTFGVSLAARILATLPGVERLGTEPARIRRIMPADIYRKLLSIYQPLHETLALTGEPCLMIEEYEYQRAEVDPSDVYDLASLLISELAFLHSLVPGVQPPRESYFPGDKLPSDVYQRAGRLESQVVMLRDYVATHPRWLDAR